MRTVILLFSCAFLALLPAVPIAAAEEGRTEFTLVTRHQGGAYWWTLEGNATKNPELVVPPGANVTITVRNGDGNLHNVQVEGRAASPYVASLDSEVTYTLTAPESGTLRYWCAPHKANGMGGTLRVAGSPREEAREAGSPAAWAGAALALVAAAALVRRA